MLQAAHVIGSLATALSLPFLLLCGAAAPSMAAVQPDGAALFQKHCAGCHPDGPKLDRNISLLDSIRNPSSGMPPFEQEKLPDREVQAIGDYLRLRAPAASKTEPAPRAPAKENRPSKKGKSWMKGFGTADL